MATALCCTTAGPEVDEAIMWHGGEGQDAADAFASLEKNEPAELGSPIWRPCEPEETVEDEDAEVDDRTLHQANCGRRWSSSAC